MTAGRIPAPDLTPDQPDVAGQLDELERRLLPSEPGRRLIAAARAVLGVHGAINAVQYLGARQTQRRVCTGCGSDDGNWQTWPCPTVRALAAALTADRTERGAR